LLILSQPGELHNVAKKRGIQTATIIFADRAYNDNGRIVSRSEPNAVLHDPQVVIQRCIEMIVEQKVTTVTGNVIEINGNALLLHGDTEGSLDLARKIKGALEDAGVVIQSIGKQFSRQN